MAKKRTGDLKDSHFSKYGEFLVSYELSRQGWNVYGPIYDEYIDFVVSGFVCGKCRHILRTVTPQLECPCGETISNAEKKKCISAAICPECDTVLKTNKETNSKCHECGDFSRDRERFLACFRECDIEDLRDKRVKVRSASCPECSHAGIDMVFRTVQVKSSRMEPSGSYAVDHKPRDMFPSMDKPDARHFFIWCTVDNDDRASFLVVSAQEFVKEMGGEIMLPSFLKDDGREHFKLGDSRWDKYQDAFAKMQERLDGDPR